MLFPLLFGLVSQSGGVVYGSVLSLPTANSTSDTTAIIGITIQIIGD